MTSPHDEGAWIVLVDLIPKYAWTEEDHDFVWTLAVIQGHTIEHVLRAYGGNPAESVCDYSFAQLCDLQGAGEPDALRFHVQVFGHAGSVVALENNGYAGAVPEIARRCSTDGGRFFSVFWNINGAYSIVQAINGTVTASFDPLLAGPDPWPGWIYPEWLDLDDFSTDEIRPVCLAYLENQTGVSFDQTLLNDPRSTYGIPDPDSMLKDIENARRAQAEATADSPQHRTETVTMSCVPQCTQAGHREIRRGTA
jgi:hypothetical protein